MSTSQGKESSTKQEPDNSSVVEEKIIKVTGDVQIRKYYKGRLLGKGGFAKCYEFTCAENKKIFAAKVVAKSGLVKSRAKQKLISEIKIHKSLHHPQIVAFEHYFEDTENVYILLEMGDFGLATKLDFEGERKRTVCGTPNYIAPEILDGKTGHSYEVDIWSLGVIIYTLIIGKPPFETRDVKTTYKRIKMNAYTFPENAIVSEAAKNLIAQILVLDPSKRPTLDQILTHDFFNQGTSIPKLLPTSTLACTPSLSYIKQFMPDAGKDGIVNKPVTTTKLIDKPTGNNNMENKNDKDEKNLNINMPPQVDPNLKGPDTWVKKWVDYSSKYGLGYLLSNGYSGVFFNDSSKIILNPTNKEFFYIERRVSDKQEIINSHNMDDYPKELQKKVTLLNHFKNYLEGESNPSPESQPKESQSEEKEKEKDVNDEEKKKPYTYVKKWMRTRHAIMFRLSNKIVQVCFQDKTEIILSSESRVVTYCNKKGERMTYPLSTALEMSNYEMTKRLKYTKDILTHMLTMNQQKNAQRNNQNNNQDNYKSNNNGKDSQE